MKDEKQGFGVEFFYWPFHDGQWDAATGDESSLKLCQVFDVINWVHLLSTIVGHCWGCRYDCYEVKDIFCDQWTFWIGAFKHDINCMWWSLLFQIFIDHRKHVVTSCSPI